MAVPMQDYDRIVVDDWADFSFYPAGCRASELFQFEFFEFAENSMEAW